MIAYLVHLFIIIGIYIILATSFNLSVGYTGLLNLGHVAFFGIGAYTSALLTLEGWPFLPSLLVSGLVASVFGYILVFAVRQLKGDYLALASLGFSFVIYSFFLNWTSLTRGPLGIPGIPRPEIFEWTIGTNMAYLFFVVIMVLVVVWFLQRIVSSRYGKLLEAVRDDEIGLSVLGKNTFQLKSQSMMIAAFFAGMAGSLFAHYITYIDPSSFYLSDLILLLTIVMVGGLASLRGTIIATFLILLIPEALRFLELPSAVLGPARQMIYAGALLVILCFRPKGLYGRIKLE